jgi:hypothetical protein
VRIEQHFEYIKSHFKRLNLSLCGFHIGVKKKKERQLDFVKLYVKSETTPKDSPPGC